MRLVASVLVVGLGTVAPAAAEAADHDHGHSDDSGPRHPSSQLRPKHGGFGFGMGGFLAGKLGGVEGDLRDPIALGPGTSLPGFGYMLGGGGRMLLFRRLLIGGKGFALLAPRFGGANGEGRMVGGGGGLDLGVAIINRNRWLAYPYVGGGGIGYGLILKNTSQQAIRFGDARPILPGDRDSYGGGFGFIDVGAGAQRLLFRGHGGFIVGLEAGAMFSVGEQRWTDEDGESISGVDTATMTGGYLRLTLGGGGFSME